MRNIPLVCLIGAACVAAFDLPASAQMVFKTQGEEANDIVVLVELGAIAAAKPESEEVRVLMLLPDAPADTSLQKGDLIQMVDGRRVRGLEALRERYASAAVGETIKLGIRRGEQRFLASFDKQAPEEGKQRMIVMGGPGHGLGELQPLPEFGVIAAEKDGKLVVSMRLPAGDAAFAEGDEIRSLNGRAVGSLAELRAAYEAVAVGAEIALVVGRNGETIRAARPRSEGTVRMKVMEAN